MAYPSLKSLTPPSYTFFHLQLVRHRKYWTLILALKHRTPHLIYVELESKLTSRMSFTLSDRAYLITVHNHGVTLDPDHRKFAWIYDIVLLIEKRVCKFMDDATVL